MIKCFHYIQSLVTENIKKLNGLKLTGIVAIINLNQFKSHSSKNKFLEELNIGGDPSAGSPTDTLC